MLWALHLGKNMVPSQDNKDRLYEKHIIKPVESRIPILDHIHKMPRFGVLFIVIKRCKKYTEVDLLLEMC